jgi:hypothetical protein
MRRRWTAALAALVVAGCGARAQTVPMPFEVKAVRTPMDREKPLSTRLGPLTYAGGFSLTAPGTPQFGGVSGLDIDADGGFVAVTDAGDLIRGRLRLGRDGRLEGVQATTIRRVTDEHGRAFEDKDEGDAEDVTVLPDGGVAVSFEQEHRILVYARDGSVRRLPPPAGVRMSDNGGLEAIAYWSDPRTGEGRLILGVERGDAFSCDLDGEDCRQVLVRARDNPPGFRLTSLDALPDGRLVAVYRAASLRGGLRAVVAEVRLDDPRPVRPLVELAGTLTVDNMEAIAAVSRADGSVRLYVASDNNFALWQRTLLLAFDWRPSAKTLSSGSGEAYVGASSSLSPAVGD